MKRWVDEQFKTHIGLDCLELCLSRTLKCHEIWVVSTETNLRFCCKCGSIWPFGCDCKWASVRSFSAVIWGFNCWCIDLPHSFPAGEVCELFTWSPPRDPTIRKDSSTTSAASAASAYHLHLKNNWNTWKKHRDSALRIECQHGTWYSHVVTYSICDRWIQMIQMLIIFHQDQWYSMIGVTQITWNQWWQR